MLYKKQPAFSSLLGFALLCFIVLLATIALGSLAVTLVNLLFKALS